MIDKGSGEIAAATGRTIFAQTTTKAVHTQLNVVADLLGRQFPPAKAMLLEAATDITAFAGLRAGLLEEDLVHQPA
ncbi:hypothetical protein POF73_39275 [Streptomyces sp. HD]|nr:hypothetical protein [Streptomyces sp. HD]MDC0772874.1 hypothetical protein [Streptomyces sp. HD]